MAINIVDSIMGSGKTEWAIQYMNENPDKKFMYITPYNNEIKDRIVIDCPALKFKFARDGHKVKDFKEMLVQGKNIAATHECFKRADAEVEALLDANDYTLILDEVFDVIIDIKMAKADIDNILSCYGHIENDFFIWTDDNYPDEGGRYSDIKQLAKLKKLMVFDNSFFLWLFPIEFFCKFNEVYVMTYLFPGQIQKFYFDLHDVQYQYYKVIKLTTDRYDLIPHDGCINNNLKSLFDIYRGDMNDIGQKDYSLSKGWFDKPQNRLNIKKLKKHLNNYFRNIHDAKSKDIIWTCFKGDKDKRTGEYKVLEQLKGDGYANSFVECNCRATNKYRNRSYIAYCVNRFMRPMIKRYIGMTDDQEEIWALSEMIQFLWRSRIRDGQIINLYIPTKRMRDLLDQFLNNKIQLDYTIGKKWLSGQI